ncbi:NUMOD4 domain-containing protein [Nocardia sp. NPDC059246]|uniref:NUMOD4 domain-containing protein n=1 Tax=unclassified Nocardia TaxID=2637762 RepID=UPI0036830889
MTEEWIDIDDWNGLYQVSDLGRVRSLSRKVPQKRWHNDGKRTIRTRILKPGSSRGYPQVVLQRDGRRVRYRIHRLVAGTFLADSYFEGAIVCHNDGDKTNNVVGNLRWDTPSENNHDTVRHGNNKQANRELCLRGHVLREPNLMTCRTRGCLACNRAAGVLRYRLVTYGESITPESMQLMSDEKYKEIMRGF